MPDPIPNDNTKAIFNALKACAKEMRTMNYATLAVKAGVAKSEAKFARKAMAQHLKYIRDKICAARGLPHLNQLAVAKKTWFPGDSVLPKKYKIPPEAARVIWRGMVLQVFVYPWEDVPFDEE